MNFSKFLLFSFLTFSSLFSAQDNYFLKPVEHTMFSNLNSDYYYLLNSIFFQKENPTLALLKTSHNPESVFFVTFEINSLKYYINYKIAKASIWEKYFEKSKNKIKIVEFKKELNTDSYELLKELFDSNLYNAKFDPNYHQYFDGEQYLFYCEKKSAEIESVSEKSNVYKSIMIVDEIINLLKDNKNNKIKFSNTLQLQIKDIIKANNNYR